MELNLDDDRLIDVPVNDAVINVRIIPADELTRMRKKFTRQGFKRGVPVDDFDSTGFARAFWDRTIVSWTGLNRDGAPIPCTAENKFLVISRYDEIATTISEAIEATKADSLVAETAAQQD